MKRTAHLLVFLAVAASAAAQAPKAPPAKPLTQTRAPGDVETDPIKCFWKTDRSTVIVGERFTVVLTCGIVETEKIKAVPDFNQLEPTTIGLQPFEVVKGVRHEDIKSAPWRYIQYEYSVRTIADAFFDKDMSIPPVKITYHIQSSVGGGSTGRDQAYQLPPLPIRITSLVPQKTADIRDSRPDTFAEIEARRVRSTGEFVAAAIAFGFAVVLLGLAIVRVVGRYRVRTPAADRPLGLGAVLSGCLRETARVQSDAAGGWTPELAGRALTVLRIGGAVALDRPVVQAIVDAHVAGHEGQLSLRKGVFRPRRSLVSTATTPAAIARSMSHGHGAATSARTDAILKDLEESLTVLTAARYGRDGTFEASSLNTALENGVRALKSLRGAQRWPMRMIASIMKSASDIGAVVWSR
jgi:hypothetical protein